MAKRWSPVKAAVVVFCALVLLAAIVAFAMNPRKHRGEAFQEGQELGVVIGPLVLAGTAVAYFVQKRRISKDQ
jgi:hypothetical protein